MSLLDKNNNDKNADNNCPTGTCPPIKESDEHIIKLSEGSGGKEMHRLISEIRKRLDVKTEWTNSDDDSAVTKIGDKYFFFTTDSYIVTPIFFPGGDIGKISFCGTVNDLVVQGAKPLGISLSIVLEEGFKKNDLFKIIDSINEMSKMTNIPIVTGDTKVMENKSVDGIIINTSGIGIGDFVLDKKLEETDVIIVSGGIGEHGAALLAKRFEIETELITDSKPLVDELHSVNTLIKQAKDITRGGLASVLNEIASKNEVQFHIIEENVPLLQEVRALTNVLGIDAYNIACEGRFVCISSKQNAATVLSKLKKFNALSAVIGEVKNGKGVIVQTRFGTKVLSTPSGSIVPRIC
jgi:hydrogenase expression/formation protein HypE